MTIVIPLWLGLVVPYAVIALLFMAAGWAHESSFVNPDYGIVVISGLLWPLCVLNVIIGDITGRYIIGEFFNKYL